MPDFYALATQLYKAGLITGLRGISIEYPPYAKEVVEQLTGLAPINTCEECTHWQRDTTGDGYGIGSCLQVINRKELKWPGQVACAEFMKAQ